MGKGGKPQRRESMQAQKGPIDTQIILYTHRITQRGRGYNEWRVMNKRIIKMSVRSLKLLWFAKQTQALNNVNYNSNLQI